MPKSGKDLDSVASAEHLPPVADFVNVSIALTQAGQRPAYRCTKGPQVLSCVEPDQIQAAHTEHFAARAVMLEHAAHGGGRRQDVSRSRHSSGSGTPSPAAGGGLEYVVEDVGCVNVRADQQVGRAAGVDPPCTRCGCWLQRGVTVQFAVAFDLGVAATNRSRFTHLAGRGARTNRSSRCDRNATLGGRPKRCTSCTDIQAMSASSCGRGSSFT